MEPVALPHTRELPRLTDLTCGPRMGDTGQVPPASGHTVPTAGPDAAGVRPREAWQLPAAPAPSPRPIPVCFPKAQERGVQILNLVGKLPPTHTPTPTTTTTHTSTPAQRKRRRAISSGAQRDTAARGQAFTQTRQAGTSEGRSTETDARASSHFQEISRLSPASITLIRQHRGAREFTGRLSRSTPQEPRKPCYCAEQIEARAEGAGS